MEAKAEVKQGGEEEGVCVSRAILCTMTHQELWAISQG